MFGKKTGKARAVARVATVGWTFANNVISEYKMFGYIEDPTIAKENAAENKRQKYKIRPLEGVILLALRVENISRLRKGTLS